MSKKLRETLYCAVRTAEVCGEYFDLDTISAFEQEVKYQAGLDSPGGRVCRIVSVTVTEEETIE